MEKRMINFELSEQQLENEIRRVQKVRRSRSALRNAVFALIVIAAIVVLAAAFLFPMLEISESSMLPMLECGWVVPTFWTEAL